MSFSFPAAARAESTNYLLTQPSRPGPAAVICSPPQGHSLGGGDRLRRGGEHEHRHRLGGPDGVNLFIRRSAAELVLAPALDDDAAACQFFERLRWCGAAGPAIPGRTCRAGRCTTAREWESW